MSTVSSIELQPPSKRPRVESLDQSEQALKDQEELAALKDQKAATGESEDEDKDDDDDDDDLSEPTQEQCMLAFFQFECSMRPKTLCRICSKDSESLSLIHI